MYLRFSGVCVWQSPPLCSELLSHLGQSLKVSPINGKEGPGLTQIVIHSDMNVALYVRAQSYQLVGSNDLNKMNEELYKTQLLLCSSDQSQIKSVFSGTREKKDRSTWIILLYITVATKLQQQVLSSLWKGKKKNGWRSAKEDKLSQSAANFLHFLSVCVCVRNCSPAVCLVRFVLWGDGKAGTQSAPQRVRLSSPDQTAGSRNSEPDLLVYFPIKTRRVNSIFMFKKIYWFLHLN